jgi:hypothetical protein
VKASLDDLIIGSHVVCLEDDRCKIGSNRSVQHAEYSLI